MWLALKINCIYITYMDAKNEKKKNKNKPAMIGSLSFADTDCNPCKDKQQDERIQHKNTHWDVEIKM